MLEDDEADYYKETLVVLVMVMQSLLTQSETRTSGEVGKVIIVIIVLDKGPSGLKVLAK